MAKSTVSGNNLSSERIDKAIEDHKAGRPIEDVTSYERKMIESKPGPLLGEKK